MIKKRLIALLDHAKKYIFYNVAWQWISLIFQVIAIFTITNMLGNIVEKTFIKTDLVMVIAILVVCIIVRFFAEKMATKASYNASVDVKRILRKNIYEKMLRLGTAYRDHVATSEIMQVSTEGVEQLEIYFGKYLPQFFYSLLAPLTLFIILAPVSFKASIVLLICVPLIPMSIVAVQKIAKRLLSKYWSIYTGLGDSFLENVQGLTTLKIYQADKMKTLEMDKEAEHFRNITMKVLTMQLNSTSVMDIVAYGGAAVGMIVAVNEFLHGNLSFASSLTIILLASEFFIPLRLLGSFFHIAMNGMAASDKIFAILDLEEPVRGGEIIETETPDIEIKDLSFNYNPEREILKHINLEVKNGQFVSIVGESGSGKSTIAGLIWGKNRGYSGQILIDNKALESIDEEDLMKKVVMVRHNSYLFKGTVRENLLMANPDATEQEMREALKDVNLLAFLEEQEGLDTILLEKASNISGGQAQRLAIARALLTDAPIYIFDEATSNIDLESEAMIMNVIYKLARTKTVILISHRLANVVLSDRIYLLKNGEILESGTHQELIDNDGEYKHLYQNQAELENYGKKVA